jgi:H+-translocating NAD(P) transhydrogenase subunit alpha
MLTDMTPDKKGEVIVNMEDEAIRGATIINKGEITWPPPPPRLSAAPKKQEPAKAVVHGGHKQEAKPASVASLLTVFGVGALALLGLGSVAPPEFMSHFTVFVLACFVGYMVIWNVSPSLHTPLMSVTNAISSIIVIGALIQVSSADKWIMYTAGFAIFITSINIFGGFAVTQRMLQMFRK